MKFPSILAVLFCAALLPACGKSAAPAANPANPVNESDGANSAPAITRLAEDVYRGRIPERATIQHVTMESLDQPRYAWDITVPANAEASTMAAITGEGDQIPEGVSVQLAIFIERKGSPPLALAQTTVTSAAKGWFPLVANLGAFAGQTVTLVLASNIEPPDQRVRAVWGNPILQTRATRDGVPVILISCDTTRADHLGCYGYSRDTTPNIDAFTREAVLFENAITPETWTLTAHLSMLTGLLPKNHRAATDTNLAEEVATLPELLRSKGYISAGYTGYGIWMQPTRGFAQGFDLYSTPPITRDFFRTLALATPWIESHANSPFFLFLHNYDHHSKYMESDCEGCDMPYYPSRPEFLKFSKDLQEPPTLRAPGRARATDLLFAALNGKETLSPEEIEYMIALYDDSLRGVDDGIGQFIAKLKEFGIYDKALIVITADHGENFGEHGQFLHEHVYEGSARAPLLIRFPSGEHGGKRVKEMVQLIDIAPTICEYLKVDAPDMDGESLLPIVRGEKKPRDKAFVQRLKHIAVRTNDWKLIRNTETKEEELYHLADDPVETLNLFESNPAELSALRATLDEFLSAVPKAPAGGAARPLTDEEIEALRGQGYSGDL